MLNLEMLYLLVGLSTAYIDDEDMLPIDASMTAEVADDASVILSEPSAITPDEDEYFDIGI